MTAAPRANGFFTAKGASKRIPGDYFHCSLMEKQRNRAATHSRAASAAYVLLERRVWDAVERAGLKDFVLSEYNRQDWTFHAKGIWFAEAKEALPFGTSFSFLIASSDTHQMLI